MTEDEALKKAREAMKRAVRRFGNDRAAVQRAIEEQKGRDPSLEEAFAISGRVFLQAEQNIKH